MSLRYAYNTNGLTNHRLRDALEMLAEGGYDGVALTLDHCHLDPFGRDLWRRLDDLRWRLDRLGLSVVVETGARFILDPRRKHEPTLLSGHGREIRADFLIRAVRIARELNAEAVSFWSGARPNGVGEGEAWRRLADGCARVLEEAEDLGVPLGFEPEPGHLIETVDGYGRLLRMLGDPPRLGLTLDVGHCLVVGEGPAPVLVRRWAGRLVNVHVEDMRGGVHEHLDFGEGEMDFPPILAALSDAGYGGLVGVELSRHAHAADLAVPKAIRFLRAAEEAGWRKEASA